MRQNSEVQHKVSTGADSVTVTDLPGYEGCLFIVGFPPGESQPNGFFVRMTEGATVRLTPTLLRRLPYDRLMKIAVEVRVRQLGEAVAPEAGVRPYGGGDEHARAVAEVYQWAVEHGISPRKAVASRWAKSEATAGRWITQARKLGLLPPYGEESAR
ncbi:hypothetical protein [Streptomyces sp. NPDC101150]|uniref:hypothetical protein n=1 Tax=Streptomyces sp. NPDC101150 TaxID=3366114 RepID=UPI003816AF83